MSTEKPKRGSGSGRKKMDIPENIREEILDAISTTSKSLKTLCSENTHWPCARTIYRLLRDDTVFSHQYAQAHVAQAGILAHEIIEIADNIENDTIFDDEGFARPDKEWIARSRLKIDTRKWLASKLIPKVYGDRITQETTVTIKHEDALKQLE